ncbi:hypothetical protein TBLA_0H01030 [Henningerozyma blattae CBS 6284]|uniref:Kinase n=1 Tax=Henningerozyma blattae (strain ATCC 34711 / CBS 6284 / DSM 70876 / NBRC 10599 / NRRL Y-10934 / UCD 77-7) TaxID=1071380 RepID=I2H7N9_HENB6|nr:hypothetical protein TBLA_0H01030 [Tetrapisispora blattae CBS 6284]CCH62391.1 hypothetical protein TBLA_0H01030 [Tetrapisispora blattae CBS 6284]
MENSVPGKHLRHQAAGHDGTLTDDEELLVFKPCAAQELAFYKQVQESYVVQTPANLEKVNSILEGGDVPFHYWIPSFLGVLEQGTHTVPDDNSYVYSQESLPITESSTPDSISFETRTNSSTPMNIPIDIQSVSRSGTLTGSNNDTKSYIVLENLLKGYSKPNIMDIKLGKILYDSTTASTEKMERLADVSANTTSGSLSFRICGMILDKNNNLLQEFISNEGNSEYFTIEEDYVLLNKLFGRSRDESNILHAINLFFNNTSLSTERQQYLKETFLKRLSLLYNTLLDTPVRMISSSLLYIYDSDSKRWDLLNDEDSIVRNNFLGSRIDSDNSDDDDNDDDGDNGDDDDDENGNNNNSNQCLSSLSLIDFAHSKFVAKELGCDENVIVGVENLIELFNNL